MKALTLYQPWATLIAIGAKRIETRSWSTNYRGPLAIHAGKNTDFIRGRGKYYICDEHPFCDVLIKAGLFLFENPFPGAIPLGCIVATCELVDCILMDEKFLSEPVYCLGWSVQHPEVAFGDFRLGRYAWMLNKVKLLPEPIPAKGAMGLWEWSETGSQDAKN